MRPIKTPRVSVIMGIYNCENTLSEAIESILSQTYSNLELIMCDDGSTDNTYKVAKDYANKNQNITLIKNEMNEGLAYTLNKCLKYSTGTLIARQDGDDISVPKRIEKQVGIFLKNSEISIVSTNTIHFDESGKWGQFKSPSFPTNLDFVKESPFSHGSAMIRKVAINAVNGYDSTKKTFRAEDYDLWFRMYAAGFIGENIQESLYFVRDDQEAYKRRKFRYRIIETNIRYRGFKMLEIPLHQYVFILRPIIVGIVPKKLYTFYRKRKYLIKSGYENEET